MKVISLVRRTATVAALAIGCLAPNAAHAASVLSWTTTITPDNTTTPYLPGAPGTSTTSGMILNPNTAGTPSVTTPTAGVLDAINYGIFNAYPLTGSLTNSNVDSKFTVTISGLELNGVSISSQSLTFYGTITATGTLAMTDYNIAFSNSSTGPATQLTSDPSYPTAGIDDTFVYQDLGGYAFALTQDINWDYNNGKTVGFYGIVSTSPTMTPEPASLALSALAGVGLLGFSLRRKWLAARS